MLIQILQHSPGTPPGTLLDWATARGHQTGVHRLDLGAPLPRQGEADMLVILGGPMNVNQVTEHPWLRAEKAYLTQAIRDRATCLGLCLGGQLLAESLGGTVINSLSWEIGWHPVALTNGLVNGSSLQVFQWHQDNFSLPKGAKLLAGNNFSEIQAFSYDQTIVGVQFHPEATEEFVHDCAMEADYPAGKDVQSPSQLRAGLHHLPLLHAWFFSLLDDLASAAQQRK